MTEPGILHVDLDAFYAAVEELDDPALRGRPVVVGGLGRRGVVAAANYEARRYGIYSATPVARARRLCPDAVFRAPRFERYAELSRRVMAVLESFTPLVEPLALDEAFLDVRGVRLLHGDAPAIARAAKERIRAETGLVASVGVATTKILAKIASDLGKPDGFVVVAAGQELDVLHPLRVRRLFGVGPKTAARLERLGVVSIGDLARLPVSTLERALGPALGRQLHDRSWNRDDRPVVPDRAVKSIGHEETFPSDRHGRAELAREVVRLAELVADRLRRADRVARTVQLKVRFPDFRTITRAVTPDQPVDGAPAITRAALALFEQVDTEPGVRLLGVSVRQLAVAQPDQRELFDVEADDPQRRVEHAVDAVRARFGTDAVGPAVLAGRDGFRVTRRASLWGPDDDSGAAASEEPG